MKKYIIFSIVALLTAGWSITNAQEFPEEYLGLPGDNLNLYAVMKLFQESETLESFERSLNDENTMINNLDLNRDNLVDYIMVFDYVDGNVHTIVLRVDLDPNETQDVAVFTVQRFNDGSVQIQLVGDVALYGNNYIVEPYYTDPNETPNPGYVADVTNNNRTVVQTTVYEVATWPLIRYIYLPTYIGWHSSWRWGYYPSYWNPWNTLYWHTYYGYHSHWHPHYYRHFRIWHRPRYHRYHDFYYTKIRHFSPTVNINIRVGKYKNTYSRPDLKTRGEAIYTRRQSEQNAGTVRNTSGRRIQSTRSESTQRSNARVSSQTGRQAVSSSTARSNNRQAAESVSGRQASTTRDNSSPTERRVTNPTEKRATETSGRSTTVATPRKVTQPSGNQTNGTRRTVSTPPSKPATKSSVGTSSTVSRRSSTRTNSSTPARSSVRTNTSTQKKAVQSTSGRSASNTRSAVKTTQSGSSSKRSGSAVKSNSGSRSNVTRQSSRSSSSGSSGRRR